MASTDNASSPSTPATRNSQKMLNFEGGASRLVLVEHEGFGELSEDDERVISKCALVFYEHILQNDSWTFPNDPRVPAHLSGVRFEVAGNWTPGSRFPDIVLLEEPSPEPVLSEPGQDISDAGESVAVSAQQSQGDSEPPGSIAGTAGMKLAVRLLSKLDLLQSDVQPEDQRAFDRVLARLGATDAEEMDDLLLRGYLRGVEANANPDTAALARQSRHILFLAGTGFEGAPETNPTIRNANSLEKETEKNQEFGAKTNAQPVLSVEDKPDHPVSNGGGKGDQSQRGTQQQSATGAREQRIETVQRQQTTTQSSQPAAGASSPESNQSREAVEDGKTHQLGLGSSLICVFVVLGMGFLGGKWHEGSRGTQQDLETMQGQLGQLKRGRQDDQDRYQAVRSEYSDLNIKVKGVEKTSQQNEEVLNNIQKTINQLVAASREPEESAKEEALITEEYFARRPYLQWCFGEFKTWIEEELDYWELWQFNLEPHTNH